LCPTPRRSEIIGNWREEKRAGPAPTLVVDKDVGVADLE
jgi:hypothetical protein